MKWSGEVTCLKKILEYFSKCKLGRISDGWYEAPHQERDPSRVMAEIYSAIWEEKGGEGSSDLSESGYLLSTHSYLLLPPSHNQNLHSTSWSWSRVYRLMVAVVSDVI